MTDLTVNADALHRAKPRGAIACPRRQAEPRAVLLMPWPDEVSRPYCRSWPICGASRPAGIFGRTAVFDGLGSLRPAE